MKEIIFLEVPFEDKEAVKSLGARWHGERHKWFVPKDADVNLFTKWLPELERAYNLKAHCPFYLLKSKEPCWKCGALNDVITFASQGYEANGYSSNKFVTYSYVALVPDRLKKFLGDNFKKYYIDFSNTTKTNYYINHCKECDASLGDFFNNSFGHAFTPRNSEAARNMELVLLKEEGIVSIHAEINDYKKSLILEYAMKSRHQPSNQSTGKQNDK